MSNTTLKPTLDKDLEKVSRLQGANTFLTARFAAPSLSFVFLLLAMGISSIYMTGELGTGIVIAAAGVGAYLALNIGANDVANNVGPAVGSQALSITGALIIAAIFESAGALIAGGDVVGTISKGIIDPATVSQSDVFVRVMLSALVSSALWVNLATWIGAPVSTTHAVVGGVMGSGMAASGYSSVNWDTMGSIAASWVISPVLGGLIAAAFLFFIKTFIIYQSDKIAAARRWVPLLISIMVGAFSAYLAMKGLKKVISITLWQALLFGFAASILSYLVVKPLIARQAEGLENRNQSLRKLFRMPLICSAALLSFAHGANDVANAIGPLAAIVHTISAGEVAAKVSIPLWVMVIGACGISFGLLLFGPKLIRMVGEQITKLNPMRAYCVALSAAITVIIASGFGLPVSSTHIAVGAVFGVGFFREWYTRSSKRRVDYMHSETGRSSYTQLTAKTKRPKLVRRSHFTTIVAAWVITVPASAGVSAMVYAALTGLLMP
ncbi:inorganic phosphate transporter [Pseudovibrio sp. SPO723]|uniref:inorganic phosphate transporter n=1 Tax=Nesiotobacter zosterae TaxID=392721 RepID=UPI0029C5C9F6|nr:inorganic phosphate transporter [Pseudovibrio sp. SPO723]MDX5593829.1 inorganic phosphate transporter [Pseudovibrio sp. SPO723]